MTPGTDPIPTRMWRWSETPFPLSNGLNIYIRYPVGEVPPEDVPRLVEFLTALLVQPSEDSQ